MVEYSTALLKFFTTFELEHIVVPLGLRFQDKSWFYMD